MDPTKRNPKGSSPKEDKQTKTETKQNPQDTLIVLFIEYNLLLLLALR